MRRFVFLAVLMLAAAPTAIRAGSPVVADYVEARTASVFAGACHYNGEVVTTGREAVLAWRVTGGSWRGVDLEGARAVAVVGSDATLADEGAARRSELVVDAATDRQADALAEALAESYAPTLGTVEVVRRQKVTFEREGGSYRVEAPGFAALSVDAMPNAECCKMPNLVWYSPLAKLTDRKVGFTNRAFYAGGAAGATWERARENSAFYGLATLEPQNRER